jgi:hypothetical protein
MTVSKRSGMGSELLPMIDIRMVQIDAVRFEVDQLVITAMFSSTERSGQKIIHLLPILVAHHLQVFSQVSIPHYAWLVSVCNISIYCVL